MPGSGAPELVEIVAECAHETLQARRLSLARMNLVSMDPQASTEDVLVCDVRHHNMCSITVSQQESDTLRVIHCLPPCRFAHIADMALPNRIADASSCSSHKLMPHVLSLSWWLLARLVSSRSESPGALLSQSY